MHAAKEQKLMTSGRVSRESEAQLVHELVSAATEKRAPRSPKEADQFRFAAQLLKTRHKELAMAMECASSRYFSKRKVRPRSFSAVVEDGLVGNVARLRNLMEKELEGVKTW